jgi:hypothetical protein
VDRRVLLRAERETAAELVPDPAAAAKLKLLYLSCGNKDRLINISQGVHAYLKARRAAHLERRRRSHTPRTWANNLYHFAQHFPLTPANCVERFVRSVEKECLHRTGPLRRAYRGGRGRSYRSAA